MYVGEPPFGTDGSYQSLQSHEFELVQAERPNLYLPRMPLAIFTRMPHIRYHTDRHEQRKRVTWSFL